MADTLSAAATVAFFTGSVILSAQATRQIPVAFPPPTAAVSTSVSTTEDLGGVVLGLRRLAADLAWIQTLQYYGAPEGGDAHVDVHGHHDIEAGVYTHLLENCRRVARIDPFFTYVYYYGAAALAWNLNRLGEAEELLKEGIRYNPHEWRFQQYLAAMAYQKNHDISKLTVFLEGFVTDPSCPNLLRALLANLYKRQNEPRKAVAVWFLVLDTGDPEYTARATREIEKLAPSAVRPSGPDS
jgi:hypothetical protein